ncbi:hypothetical protein [Wolbachia endosymbiont of Cimex lectularius]|uniref:hypothetical protein n=1 Tax=Wolbachia endosymbiont of Cimex lectularius TaxID=246273 RepID=UPI0011AE5929|nr:hypothetical protein [Wolbachia endosymbiont of Cimex lectularius]
MINKKEIEEELDFSIGGVKVFASGVESELDQADLETKLSIILYLVRSIKIDHDDMHIVFRFQELAMEMQEKNVQHCIVMQNSMYLAYYCLIFRTMCTACLLKLRGFYPYKLKRAYKSFKTSPNAGF